jgi:hypothetical protein
MCGRIHLVDSAGCCYDRNNVMVVKNSLEKENLVW